MSRWLLILLLLLVGSAWPAPAREDLIPAVLKAMGRPLPDPVDVSPASMTLNQALSHIRLLNPDAVVSSGFYDWRAPSIYRTTPGLHAGYDIALNAGAPVPAAWPGRVVSVLNWYGSEYGVTVETAGYRVTYGHLSPKVQEGDLVSAGQVVGTVVVDHVDIKMRDAAGHYIDFGARTAWTPAPGWKDVREWGIFRYLAAEAGWYDAQNRARDAAHRSVQLAASLKYIVSKEKQAAADEPKMQQFYRDGLISRLDAESATKKLAALRRQVKQMKAQQSILQRQAVLSKQEVVSAKELLATVTADNVRLGISKSDVQSYVQKFVDKNPKAVSKALASLTQKTDVKKLQALSKQAAAEQEKLRVYESLFKDGAVSEREVEEQRLKVQQLLAELKS